MDEFDKNLRDDTTFRVECYVRVFFLENSRGVETRNGGEKILGAKMGGDMDM